ncbi:glutathione S-transferase T3-like [Salvia divinorum]|uniref:Glutathione S-transferase T3-like n=1 Tax=Salvia divinorum TaxID=28513 RepID=A0ABD1HR19_SALDI
MLRCYFECFEKDLKKFNGIFRNEEMHYRSEASRTDILRAAVMVFLQDTGRAFKYANTWEKIRHLDRWAGGLGSSSGSSSKRTKNTTGGQYTSSGGGVPEAEDDDVASDFPTGDIGGSSSGGRRRPIGTKAARARGRGDGPLHTGE